MASKINQAQFERLLAVAGAREQYVRFADPSGLQALGIDPKTIKRPRGRPPKHGYSNEEWVQLVFKQQLQVGKPFSNAHGADLNQCFYGVADAQGVNVSRVRDDWDSVPPERRRAIRDWLKTILDDHGELHTRHRK